MQYISSNSVTVKQNWRDKLLLWGNWVTDEWIANQKLIIRRLEFQYAKKTNKKNVQKLLVIFKTWKKYKLEMLTLLTGHHVKCVPVGNYSCCSNTDSSYRRYSYLPSEDSPIHQYYSPNQAFGRSSPWWLGERTEGPLGQNVVTVLGLVQLPRHKALRPLVPTKGTFKKLVGHFVIPKDCYRLAGTRATNPSDSAQSGPHHTSKGSSESFIGHLCGWKTQL